MKPLHIVLMVLVVSVAVLYSHFAEVPVDSVDVSTDEHDVVVDFICASKDGHSWDFVVTHITGGVQEALDNGVVMEWVRQEYTWTTTWPRTGVYSRRPGSREITLTLYQDGKAISEPLTKTFVVGHPMYPGDEIWRLWNVWDSPD